MKSFLRISLPIARPAIAVGLALVCMETLNDFGTVDYFAVKSLSAGIYDAWLNMGNLGAAAQIAVLLMIFISVLILLERISRSKSRQFTGADRYQPIEPYTLSPGRASLALVTCLLPVILGFAFPFAALIWMAFAHIEQFVDAKFLLHAFHSFSLSISTSLIALCLAITLAYTRRIFPEHRLLIATTNFANLGYALPGAVLAIGVIIPLAAFDNTVDQFMRTHFDLSTGLLLSGTPFALIFAYTVRFLAVSSGSVDASLAKVTTSMDMASRSLGANSLGTLRRVHLPLIRGGLLTAVLVVFVDCMKELPATLILRPFNFDTLATTVYQFASDEKIETGAPAALLIVLVGIVPVILLSRTISGTRVSD